MPTFLRLFAVVVLSLLAPMTALHADDTAQPYTDEVFAAAQAAGRPILVDIWASWCPTCRRQGRVLTELLAEARFADVLWLKVDFDVQKDTVARFEAPRQSVLIMYRGDAERARVIAETRVDDIRALLESAQD
jgi:thiol-disulfide isomerase/thioredoxin